MARVTLRDSPPSRFHLWGFAATADKSRYGGHPSPDMRAKGGAGYGIENSLERLKLKGGEQDW